MVLNVRIDDRMIHGQVAAIWCNKLKTTRIMVANDEVASDEIRKMTLKMAVPAGIKSSIISKEKAATNMSAGKYDAERMLLILTKPQDAVELIEKGMKIETINVGNLGFRDNTVQIKRSINVTKEEAEAFRKLDSMGVKLTAIMVPDESENNLMDYLSQAGL